MRVTKHLVRANPRAVMEGETDGLIKLLSDPDDGTILGGAMVGLRASEVITTVALAVHARLSVQVLAETAAVNPSMSESLQRAAEKAAEGMLGISRVTLTELDLDRRPGWAISIGPEYSTAPSRSRAPCRSRPGRGSAGAASTPPASPRDRPPPHPCGRARRVVLASVSAASQRKRSASCAKRASRSVGAVSAEYAIVAPASRS